MKRSPDCAPNSIDLESFLYGEVFFGEDPESEDGYSQMDVEGFPCYRDPVYLNDVMEFQEFKKDLRCILQEWGWDVEKCCYVELPGDEETTQEFWPTLEEVEKLHKMLVKNKKHLVERMLLKK